jgi:hypothetical protein
VDRKSSAKAIDAVAVNKFMLTHKNHKQKSIIMKNETEIKELVKEKYSQIASQSKNQNASSCCGATGCGDVYNIMADDYTKLEGYNPEPTLVWDVVYQLNLQK